MSGLTVVPFNGYTTLPIEPDKVLNAAIGECSTVLVIGVQHDGNSYYASSESNPLQMLRMLEVMRLKIMDGSFYV